jgi:hypothetical protein
MRRLYVRLRGDGYLPARAQCALQSSFGLPGSFGPKCSHSDAHSAARFELETAWGGGRT